MSKNKQDRQQKMQAQQKQPAQKPQGISGRGKKVIAAGILCLVIGFIVLSMTDPAGRNAASVISPFLIVGGYIIIGIGIIIPDPSPAPHNP